MTVMGRDHVTQILCLHTCQFSSGTDHLPVDVLNSKGSLAVLVPVFHHLEGLAVHTVSLSAWKIN